MPKDVNLCVCLIIENSRKDSKATHFPVQMSDLPQYCILMESRFMNLFCLASKDLAQMNIKLRPNLMPWSLSPTLYNPLPNSSDLPYRNLQVFPVHCIHFL